MEVEKVWSGTAPMGMSAYAKRKRIEDHGVQYGDNDELYVPLRDVEGKLWSLQTVYAWRQIS